MDKLIALNNPQRKSKCVKKLATLVNIKDYSSAQIDVLLIAVHCGKDVTLLADPLYPVETMEDMLDAMGISRRIAKKKLKVPVEDEELFVDDEIGTYYAPKTFYF